MDGDHHRTYLDKAWHLLATLLRLGRPASAGEVASFCTGPFIGSAAVSPELVEFLCSIPGTPLALGEDGLVTASDHAIASVCGFLMRRAGPFLPREVGNAGSRWGDWDGNVYWRSIGRKRKINAAVYSPSAKRRPLLLPAAKDDESRFGCNVSSSANGIQYEHTVDVVNFNCNTDIVTGGDNIGKTLLVNPSTIIALDRTIFCCSLDSSFLILHGIWNKIKHFRAVNINEIKLINSRAVEACYDGQDSYNFSNWHNHVYKIYTTMYNTAAGITSTESFPVCKFCIGLECFAGMTENPKILELHGSSKFCHGTCEVMTRLRGTFTESKHLEARVGTEQVEASHAVMDCKEINCYSKIHILDSCNFKLSTESSLLPAAVVEDGECFPSDGCAMAHRAKITYGSTNVMRTPRILKNGKNDDNDEQQDQVEIVSKFVGKKLRKSRNQNVVHEKSAVHVSADHQNHLKSSKSPQFESFTVEEEEGSGGYGTVYRVRRKTDGKTFAIKYPHPKANPYHVNNELKMLERFGGRSFIIKFEGSFKSNNCECFVLEHVEHDRPEVLKREIDVTEIQWYGYCMFKALASLHREGIAHRDVKPGNFLFSRKHNKGYLIDFNLATDLHHKHHIENVSRTNAKEGLPRYLPNGKSTASTSGRKAMKAKPLDVVNKGTNKDAKKPHIQRFFRNATEYGSKSKYGSQNADVSGLTSIKDGTSTQTPSVERLREPIPCHGRKELIDLVQEVMQTSNQKPQPAPSSQRKRVAAPLGRMQGTLALLSPMPLHLNGMITTSARLSTNKGDGRCKNEGPCVGTKGFRAPEVLFKSLHQGWKADIWSAGVTLLYLMIGRTPFGGDPQQNIRDIAQLRGSEDLWEVAKLHNREPSFPSDLLEIQSLESMELKIWCEKNTKRPEFLEKTPGLLFDLVDKCLTVNPRLRISAEEALRHEFFRPCRESMGKQRSLRLSRKSDCRSLNIIKQKGDSN